MLLLVKEQTMAFFPSGRPFISTVVPPIEFTETGAEFTPDPEQLTVPVGTALVLVASVALIVTGEPCCDSTGTRLTFIVTASGLTNVSNTVVLPMTPFWGATTRV
jgi:hypothetical protein